MDRKDWRNVWGNQKIDKRTNDELRKWKESPWRAQFMSWNILTLGIVEITQKDLNLITQKRNRNLSPKTWRIVVCNFIEKQWNRFTPIEMLDKWRVEREDSECIPVGSTITKRSTLQKTRYDCLVIGDNTQVAFQTLGAKETIHWG